MDGEHSSSAIAEALFKSTLQAGAGAFTVDDSHWSSGVHGVAAGGEDDGAAVASEVREEAR